MNHPRSTAVLTLLAASLGCEAKSPLGTAGAPENYQVRLVDPGVTATQTVAAGDDSAPTVPATVPAQLMVRLTVGEGRIRQIAVTNDYLYFAAWWEGVYRVPQYGGGIEVVEAGASHLFEPLTTSPDGVFWVRSQFDDRDYPSVAVKHRADVGGPITTLFAGDWGITGSLQDSNFQVGASGLSMIAGPAGALQYHLHRVPTTGGPLTRVLELPQMWPTWLLDAGQLYYTDCANLAVECTIRTMPEEGGPSRLLAVVPTSGASLTAVDQDAIYLLNNHGRHDNAIWRVGKGDGTVTEVVTAATDGVSIGHFLLVDDTRFYYTAHPQGGQAELRARAKAGGPSIVLAQGPLFFDTQQIVQGPRVLYVLHDQGRQISVVAKP